MTEKIATILCGISGAGKSSFVNKLKESSFEKETLIISKDLIRKELFNYDTNINFWSQYSFKEEKKLNINGIMQSQLEDAFRLNKSIVIDNTNLSYSKNQKLISNLENKGYVVKFVNLNFINSDINYYLERNADRLDSISDGAVNDQFITAAQSGYLDFNFKSKIAIVDLDGTVALKGDRGIFEYNNSYKDIPNTYVIETIKALLNANLIDYVQFLSGRESYSYTVTKQWLVDQGFDMNKNRLLLRKTGDHRKDVIIKKEIYDSCIKHNIVYAVFDDRPQVVDLWWDLKLPVFHVGDYRDNF